VGILESEWKEEDRNMAGPHTRGRGGGFGPSAWVGLVVRRVCASGVQNEYTLLHFTYVCEIVNQFG
jgi:hypothetical protein